MPKILSTIHHVFGCKPDAPDSGAVEHSQHDSDMCAVRTATELTADGWHKVRVESRAVATLAVMRFNRKTDPLMDEMAKAAGLEAAIVTVEIEGL